MMLKDKCAVIYGAGGSLGGAISKALAIAGARMFLTGINRKSVDKVATEIIAAGGQAEVAEVDGFNEKAINDHIKKVVEKTGKVDISFNAVGIEVKQGTPLIDLSPEDYLQPITSTLQTRYLTARAAGRVMKKQGSGIILFLTATPGGIGYPYTCGFATACCAVESLSTNLASELGIHGVRVLTIRSGGSPDSKVFKEAFDRDPVHMKKVQSQMREDTMLKDLPLMADIANAAVFLCSEMANKITGITLDVTAGTTVALNYRARWDTTDWLLQNSNKE